MKYVKIISILITFIVFIPVGGVLLFISAGASHGSVVTLGSLLGAVSGSIGVIMLD